MNILDLIPGGRDYRRSGNKNGGEFSGPCPWCGDGGKGRGSDRFRVWPQQGRGGSYWCRMCGKAGDAIKYSIDQDGLDFKAACARLSFRPEDVLGPKRDKLPQGWQAQPAARPADIWAEKALKFADWCHERMLERDRSKEQAWLAERGINLAMIKKYRLGWNPTHAWREGPAWGLTMEKKADGKLKKLWLPRGLVLPVFADDGRVLSLRIRQPEGSPRYMAVPGSSREPLLTRAAEAIFVVESRLDAILLDAVAGDLIGVVAMDNDTAKPTARLMPILQDTLFIGAALDSDLPRFNAETGGMDMPGAKASRWWLQQFRQAARVPMIGGKDPGDAFREGVDLRTWVLAALPPYFHVKAELEAEKVRHREKMQAAGELEKDLAETAALAAPVEPEEMPPAEAATVAEKLEEPAAEKSAAAGQDEGGQADGHPADPQTTVKTVTLKDGRRFCVTPDREEWDRLTAAGEIVFSDYELKRLQAACETMTADERTAAAMLVLDIKEIFAPAWIRRGEAFLPESTQEPTHAN